jgi:orotidine-5'-phosphate decarboxylase
MTTRDIQAAMADLIRLRVRQAVECGCDAVIASADDDLHEILRIAQAEHLLIATPGIRG